MKDKCILRKSNEVLIQALILQAKCPKLYDMKITYKVALSNVRFRKSLNNKDSVAGYNEEIEDRNCKYKDTSMESNNLKKAFLMEDFNKGLMLAGLVASSTQQEINDLRALNNYEKDLLILISKNNGSKLKLIDAPKFR